MTAAEIKFIRSLSSKKGREAGGLFVVEGEKMVSEALKSSFEVEKIYRIEDIGENSMSRISCMSSPPPVLGLVRIPRPVTERAVSGPGLYLALDSIRDPGNLGSILRTADWFGIDAVICSPDTVEPYNPKVVQATMGAIFRVKTHILDLQDVADMVLKQRGKLYGAFLDGENIYDKVLYSGLTAPVAIIIGNESRGISPVLAEKVTDRLFIPSCREGSESLNASVAAAICIAEFRRRTFN